MKYIIESVIKKKFVEILNKRNIEQIYAIICYIKDLYNVELISETFLKECQDTWNKHIELEHYKKI